MSLVHGVDLNDFNDLEESNESLVLDPINIEGKGYKRLIMNLY